MMITYLEFGHEDRYLKVSELNTKNVIGVYMGEYLQEINEQYMELGELEIKRLRDFLNEALETLSQE